MFVACSFVENSNSLQWTPLMTQSQHEIVSKQTKTVTDTFQKISCSTAVDPTAHYVPDVATESLNIPLHFGAMRT